VCNVGYPRCEIGQLMPVSYKPVDSHLPPSGYASIGKSDLQSREELVSVPVLGPE
jgi:hypothetical protein